MDNFLQPGSLNVDGNSIHIQENFKVDSSGNIIGNNMTLVGNIIVKKIPYLFLHRTNFLNINKYIITQIYYDTIEYDETLSKITDTTNNMLIDNTNYILYNNITNLTADQIIQDNNGIFIIPMNGLYTIEAQITFSNTDTGNTGEILLYLYKNEMKLLYSRMWKKFMNSETNTLNLTATIKLKINDNISIRIYQDICDFMQTGILFHPCWCTIRFVG